ncbi:MAG: NADH-quinone oxidoreductase subunit J [Alphaproteobacteria bacterium]|nr:NADH-quinone oxidoreductase subunit J [Alphaproteobacteria bacterium]
MIIQALAFYMFAAVVVASGVMVVTARNPVHSVLFLILAFFNAAGLFVLLGAEFLAMILVIVYVGAVAVLFLFVVMMLDINFVALREGFIRYLPVGAAVGLVLLAELLLVVGGWSFAPRAKAVRDAPMPPPDAVTNTQALGQILYTDHIYLFQAAGLVLLVAMVGAIVLTLRERVGVRRQKVGVQVGRRRDEAIEIRKLPPSTAAGGGAAGRGAGE